MKKNLKTIVLAMALLVSATGVFASDILSAVSGKKRATVSWQKIDPAGNPVGSPVIGDESNPFPEDCEGDADDCARGTVVGDTLPSLFYHYN